MSGIVKDVAYGFRMLARSAGITVTAVTAMALGIGLSATMFGLVNGLFFKGLPFPESHRLYSIRLTNRETGSISWGTPLRVVDRLFERQTSFQAWAGHSGNYPLTLSGGGHTEYVRMALVTANWLEVLETGTLFGTGFVEGDDMLGAEAKIILSHRLWVSRYAGDPHIIGKEVVANGKSATVVGVMPVGFVFPDRQQAWMPAPLDRTYGDGGEGVTWLPVYGRLHDGVSKRAAQTEVENLMRQIREEDPYLWSDEDGYDPNFAYLLIPTSREYLGEDLERVTYPMLAAALLTLLIACSNVANLEMARFSRRTKELAVRGALGATKQRMVQLILIESLLISGLGAVVGLAATHVGLTVIRRSMVILEPPDWLDLSIDGSVCAFVVVLVLAAGLIASLAPVWFLRRLDVSEALKDDSRAASSYHLGRFAKGLVIAQTALSTVLLISMGLMLRTVHELRTLDIPAELDSILNVTIFLDRKQYGDDLPGTLRVYRRLLERLEHHGEVARAATVNPVTFKGEYTFAYHIEGEPILDRLSASASKSKMISPGYFSTLGTPVLRGRDFTWADTVDTQLACIVNRLFAEKHWPGASPLGKRMRLFQPGENTAYEDWMTVVGVVPDLKMAGVTNTEVSQAGFYVPFSQFGGVHPDRAFTVFGMYLVIKTTVAPMNVTPLVRDELAKIDPLAPVYWERTLNDVLEEERAGHEIAASIFTTFGINALVLSLVGIFGVMASSVNQRTREIGVRMAVGGQRRDILRLILGQGMRQLAFGLLLGLAMTLVVARFLTALLFGVSPYDPIVYLSVPVVLAVAGISSCYLPARRAAHVQPNEALRMQ